MKLSLPHFAAGQGLGVQSAHRFTQADCCRSSCRSFLLPLRPQHHLRRSHRHISNAAESLQQESLNRNQRSPSRKDDGPQNSANPLQPSSIPSISEHVRLLMRRVPYPVAIITATDPTGPADTRSFRGMTVSSFNTVTLTPEPVISFNVRRPSETLNALLASGRFLVHLLAPNPATATLARDFSKGNATLSSMLQGHGDFEFTPLNSERTTDGQVKRPLPILRRRGSGPDHRFDFPFVFECRLHPHRIDVHDHSIVLGTVLRAIETSEELLASECLVGEKPDQHLSKHLCLTYANTKFWKMGGEI